jgi:hypothetical protein
MTDQTANDEIATKPRRGRRIATSDSPAAPFAIERETRST